MEQSKSGVTVQLQPQFFTGNPLDRSADVLKKFDGGASPGSATEVSLIVVAGREVCVRPTISEDAAGTLQQDLQALLLGATDPELDLNSEHIAYTWRPDALEASAASSSAPDPAAGPAHRLPLYLLGRDRSDRWTFALDVSEVKAAFLRFLRSSCDLEVGMADLRALMPSLSRDACAIAGQAVALSQWHNSHRFCPRCGGETMPTETGLRRKCTREPAHKQYPRTDPVVIMLVESPDGRRALLGRNKKFTAGMYTCLSGFTDQCESVEEAVRREVREEARVQVEQVRIIGTQPWPIGRYGSCELMLACIAKAQSYEIMVNTAEMEDVQWYDRDELLAAVRLYEELPDATVQELQQLSMERLGFWIPPPVAIAHHLMRTWAMHDGPFFPGGPEGEVLQTKL